MNTINVGRRGIFNGLFGNPIRERTVSPQYRKHFKKLLKANTKEIKWLRRKLAEGKILFCPGCGINSPTCHARIIEQEIALPLDAETIRPSKRKA